MRGLRTADDVAAALGPRLAARALLLGALPRGAVRRKSTRMKAVRGLRLILGDQLQHDSPLFSHFDPEADRIVMIEAPAEAAHVRSHKARIALFLSAMRHFASELRAREMPLEYVLLDDPRYADEPTLAGRLGRLLNEHRPQQLVVVEPGDWRLHQQIRALCTQHEMAPPVVLPDTHFMCSRAEFAEWARRNREPQMEYFYRWMRRRHRVLLDANGEPEGVNWNYDDDNRSPYPKTGPGEITPPERFPPDLLTREVFDLVERHFSQHPGSLEHFNWPVTRSQAQRALARFVERRLANYGPFQEAMWTDTPFGWHSLLSSSLNLKLLDPREAIAAAEQAFHQRRLPLPSVEGFVRHILGWREFLRGMYWKFMPQLAKGNYFGGRRKLPAWYWTGDTSMACMRETVGQALAHGYAHHVQRLMVTGQFGLLAETEPAQLCDWYRSMFVDAVDWVTLPNTAGMTLFADGGKFTAKPPIASGLAIKRQSNYCEQCRYKPEERVGEQACPVTVLYWNFLDRNYTKMCYKPRMQDLTVGLRRFTDEQIAEIRAQAARMLDNLDSL